MVHKAAMAKQLIPYIETLTEMQRIFVEGVLRGLTDVAAATAAGVTNPRANAHKLRKHPAVAEAIKKGKEMFARDVFFDRKKAHDMLVDAHSNADHNRAGAGHPRNDQVAWHRRTGSQGDSPDNFREGRA